MQASKARLSDEGDYESGDNDLKNDLLLISRLTGTSKVLI